MSAVPLMSGLGGTLIITDNCNYQLQIIMEQEAKFLSVVAIHNPDFVTLWFEYEAKLYRSASAACL